MGECGCSSNDERYRFPGPDKSFYVLVISAGCTSCDAPAGVSIERIDPDNSLYKEYRRGDFTTGNLKFEKWPYCLGAAVKTGMTRSEFIKACMSHLVGVRSDEMGESGAIDEAGADVILEEMYEDAQARPELLRQRKKAKS